MSLKNAYELQYSKFLNMSEFGITLCSAFQQIDVGLKPGSQMKITYIKHLKEKYKCICDLLILRMRYQVAISFCI